MLDPYFSFSKIKWIFDNVEGVKDNPDILFGTIDTWLVWKLTVGKEHITDVTNASRTMLFNIHTLSWDHELLELFDIPEYILPEIVETSGHLGMVDKVHFFNEEVEICSLVGDQQSALFGQSCFKRGSIKNTYGTGGFLLMNTGDQPIISRNGLLSTVAWKINGHTTYALEGSIFISGSLIQWLRDGLRLFDKASDTYEMAMKVPSTDGVIIVPAFTGLGAPYWNNECRGAIFGITRGTNRNHLARAALEAMAYQSKDLINVMEDDLGEKIKALKVDGGASMNDFLLQFQSDILGIDVIRNSFAEMTALGAARLAGLACGFYQEEDFAEKDRDVFEPKMEEREVDEKYSQWKKAVKGCMEY